MYGHLGGGDVTWAGIATDGVLYIGRSSPPNYDSSIEGTWPLFAHEDVLDRYINMRLEIGDSTLTARAWFDGDNIPDDPQVRIENTPLGTRSTGIDLNPSPDLTGVAVDYFAFLPGIAGDFNANMAGMIPLFFAQSLLTFPAIVASFFAQSSVAWVRDIATTIQNLFGGNSDFYWIMYFVMVVAFTFFYTNVLFAQQNYGENLKRVGAQIPGVSRGAPTQKYLNKVLSRITLPGAVFLGVVAVLPWLVSLLIPAFGNSQASNFFLVSSTGLLIVVGVVRDTFFNIQAELKLHGHDDALLIK